jgi:hypothetical protein
MSETTEHPPSPPPVPRPFHPQYPLEPTYYHVPRDRGEQDVEQGRRNPSDNDLDHRHHQYQSTYTRTEQTRHHAVTSHMPPQLRQQQQQQQQQQQHHHQGRYDPLANPRGPRGGPERWRYLGRNYERDHLNSEWVETWTPPVHPVTDIFGIFEGDLLCRPHLRYTPPEPDREMRNWDKLRCGRWLTKRPLVRWVDQRWRYRVHDTETVVAIPSP